MPCVEEFNLIHAYVELTYSLYPHIQHFLLNLIHMRFFKLWCLMQEDILSQYHISNCIFYLKSFIMIMYVTHIISYIDVRSITEK